MEVFTTEDGSFLSPVTEDVHLGPEIRSHMLALLDTKPGATAVQFSFTSTPAGGGSFDGRSTLNCWYLTRQMLYEMQVDITGHRSLGDWSIRAIPAVTTPNVMPMLISSLKQMDHVFVGVILRDGSKTVRALMDHGVPVHGEIDGNHIDPEAALNFMDEMVQASIEGGPEVIVTAIDEAAYGADPKHGVYGCAYFGGRLLPVPSDDVADVRVLFENVGDQEHN